MKKCLIVEDSLVKDIQDNNKYYHVMSCSIRSAIFPTEVEVVITNGAKQAIDLLNKQQWDHVIIDLSIPASAEFRVEIREDDKIIKTKLDYKQLDKNYTQGLIEMLDCSNKNKVNIWVKGYPGGLHVEEYSKEEWKKRLEEYILKENEVPDYHLLPYGILVAKYCIEKKQSFTIYTNDVAHGLEGIVTLALSDIINDHIIEKMSYENSGKMQWPYHKEEDHMKIIISRDNKLAIGFKGSHSWNYLINYLSTGGDNGDENEIIEIEREEY